MRFREIKHLIMQEARLDELKMSPSALEAFAKSDAARGIQAGFEAELIFPGLGDGGDSEPDYDADERAYSIDDIINFFEYDDYGYGISGREADRLRQRLENEYFEYFDDALMSEWDSDKYNQVRDYIERNDLFDQEEFIENYLRDELGLSEEQIAEVVSTAREATSSRNTPPEYRQASDAAAEELDSLVEQSIDNQDDTYDRALDEFRDDFSGVSEEDWLRENYRYMSDVSEAFELVWPYQRYEGGEGGYNEYAADQLADELADVVGMRVIASGGYHSTTRSENRWIIEPDSSLEADESDDMPAEIVSPPMPLAQCLETMERFFEWADSKGAYANSSTGFHMGVSLPITRGNVDFVKLALFLGDEHVLEQFDRSSNTYAEAAMKKIRKRIKGNSAKIDDAMKLMHNGLIELAERSIMGSTGDGFGKYTSINPKGAYIEFRSAGGEDYNKDFKKIKNTLLRYAQAMSVAANPSAERQEYYKKLYKLISPNGGNAALDLFARYSSGNITAEELKKQWAEAALAKTGAPSDKRVTWKIYDAEKNQYLRDYQYSGYTESEALALFKQAHSPGSSMEDFEKYMQHMQYQLRDVSTNSGRWEIVNRATREPIEVIDAANNRDAGELAQQKYAGKNIDYYIQPYNPGVAVAAEPGKTDRRVELAKRIKQSKEKPAGAQQSAQPIPGSTQDIQQRRAQQAQQQANQQVTTDAGIPMWEIYDRRSGSALTRFPDHSLNLAWETAQQWMRDAHVPEDRWNEYSVRALTADQPAASSQPVAGSTQDRQQQRAQPGEFTGAWAVINSITGEELHRFSGVGDVQADANRVASQWLRTAGLTEPVEVVPIVG